MSYSTIHACANDSGFVNRLTAAVMQEATVGAGQGTPFGEQARLSPQNAAGQMAYPVASASDIEAAYASALAAGNPDPGGDEAVITDGMILANVQAHWPTP